MALVKIVNDTFNISNRVKKLDKNYFIVYNTKNTRYEVHNKKQKANSLCIVCDEGLNCKVLDKLRKTRIQNLDKILQEIEQNNQRIENESKRIIKDEVDFKAREMFDYAKTRVEDCNFDQSYKTKWV